MEEEELFDEMQSLPRFAMVRKLNDLIKRAKAVKVHVTILGYLKAQMPVIGKDSKKKELIKHLDDVFKTIQSEYNIPAADFPDTQVMAEQLKKQDFTKFPTYDKSLIEKVDKMLSDDLARLMQMIPAEESDKTAKGQGVITGGVFNKVQMPVGKGVYAGIGEGGWIVSRCSTHYVTHHKTLILNIDRNKAKYCLLYTSPSPRDS